MKHKIFRGLTLVLVISLLMLSGCSGKKQTESGEKWEDILKELNLESESSSAEASEVTSNTEVSVPGTSSVIVSSSSTAQVSSNASVSSENAESLDPNSYNVNTDWFKEAKYGLFIHYLEIEQNNPENTHGFSQGKRTSWDECVKEFDTGLFAKGASETGAGYVVFTVMQKARYMIAPNEAFNKHSGFKTGEACSSRDLIADLITSLNKYNIKLILYFTADGIYNDGDASKLIGNHSVADYKGFHDKWTDVIREYSLRYGKNVAGWWIDGAHVLDLKAGKAEGDEFRQKYVEAMKAGNKNSIVSFNPGGADNLVKYQYLQDDYTAGESNHFGLPDAPLTDIPTSRFVNPEWQINRKQWHIAAPVGSSWNAPNVRYTSSNLARYVKSVTDAGGVVSLAVGVYRSGELPSRQIEALKEVSKRVR